MCALKEKKEMRHNHLNTPPHSHWLIQNCPGEAERFAVALVHLQTLLCASLTWISWSEEDTSKSFQLEVVMPRGNGSKNIDMFSPSVKDKTNPTSNARMCGLRITFCFYNWGRVKRFSSTPSRDPWGSTRTPAKHKLLASWGMQAAELLWGDSGGCNPNQASVLLKW